MSGDNAKQSVDDLCQLVSFWNRALKDREVFLAIQKTDKVLRIRKRHGRAHTFDLMIAQKCIELMPLGIMHNHQIAMMFIFSGNNSHFYQCAIKYLKTGIDYHIPTKYLMTKKEQDNDF